MKHIMKLLMTFGIVIVASCSINDDKQTGVSITGNTGKIYGTVVRKESTTLTKTAVASDTGFVTVILNSASKGSAPDTTVVGFDELFSFDSLTQGEYSIVAIDPEGEHYELTGIELNEGSQVQVSMYAGKNPPPSDWVEMMGGQVSIYLDPIPNGDVYIIDERLKDVIVIDTMPGDTIRLPGLHKGFYRVFAYSSEGMVTDMIRFEVVNGQRAIVRLPAPEVMVAMDENALPTKLSMGVEGALVGCDGYSFTGRQAPKSKVQVVYASPVHASWLFEGDTIKDGSMEVHPSVLILDSTGHGIIIGQAIGNVALASLDRYTVSSNTEEIGSTSVYQNIKMTIMQQGDTICAKDMNESRPWNNIEALYVMGGPDFTIPNLPTHSGLWLRVKAGTNAKGDAWFVESVSETELRIVNYPATGDTLAGFEPIVGGSIVDLSEWTGNGHIASMAYQKGDYLIQIAVNVPIMMSYMGME